MNFKKNMMFRKYLKTLYVLSLSTLLVACSEYDNVTPEECTVIKYITPEDTINTPTIFIDSEEDLFSLVNNLNVQRQDSMCSCGWVKTENMCCETRSTNSSIRIDTIYAKYATVDYYSDPSVYAPFSASFSQQMVNLINSEVAPDYRIDANKRYICEWRLFTASYQGTANETMSARPSPMCALIPSTRSTFTNRGYAPYYNLTTHKFEMSSYQLYIKYENVSHTTIMLDIGWPFPPKYPETNSIKGYEFIYVVLTR